MAAEPTPTLDELREVAAGLHDQWRVAGGPRPLHQPAARRNRPFVGGDLARLASVAGLARHVHETARAVEVLLDAGHSNAAIPLVRICFESALTAAWLVQSREQHGILAFAHEHARTRVALQKDALEAASATFREGASTIADTDVESYEGSIDSVRQFGQVCRDLTPGGKDAFVYYRILSSYSHASVRVIDMYFASAPDGEYMPAYRTTPDTALPPHMLMFFTAAAMVWSARAYSYLTHDKAHRNYLRSAARRLGISDELHLSEHYHRRHAKSSKRS